jgi:hypothetical protein
MALLHHFAVVVEEDGTMFIDYDISIEYDSGNTYDTTKEEWVSDTDDKVYESYQQAADRLNNLLKQTRKNNNADIRTAI